MARYIDADALIEMLNNKAKTDYEMGLYNHGALTQSFISFVERQPTAEVVPKSEVEKLKIEIESLKIANEKMYGANKAQASEIFDDIERLFDAHLYWNNCSIIQRDDIAELKKIHGGK
jgi:hypothetical protein